MPISIIFLQVNSFQISKDDGPLSYSPSLSNDFIFVLLSLCPCILQEFHDVSTAGHPGSLKNLDSITWYLWWPGLQGNVISYTKSCFSRQRAKHSNQKPPGLMNSLEVPSRPWSVISFCFIVKLPILAGFELILVVVDHFSKGVHFILANESWKAEDFVFAFFNWIIRLHGLPNN